MRREEELVEFGLSDKMVKYIASAIYRGNSMTLFLIAYFIKKRVRLKGQKN